MRDQDDYDRKVTREKQADEAISVFLAGLKDWFEGKAHVEVEIAQPGIRGNRVRFVRDVPPAQSELETGK